MGQLILPNSARIYIDTVTINSNQDEDQTPTANSVYSRISGA
jgi:hypothetical protein